MVRARLVIHKNSFILSTLSCSGTLQMMMGWLLLKEPEWGAGILSLIIGVGLILGTSHTAIMAPCRISELSSRLTGINILLSYPSVRKICTPSSCDV